MNQKMVFFKGTKDTIKGYLDVFLEYRPWVTSLGLLWVVESLPTLCILLRAQMLLLSCPDCRHQKLDAGPRGLEITGHRSRGYRTHALGVGFYRQQ